MGIEFLQNLRGVFNLVPIAFVILNTPISKVPPGGSIEAPICVAIHSLFILRNGWMEGTDCNMLLLHNFPIKFQDT